MSHNKLPYEEVYKVFKDQGCELLGREYINKKTLMKYRCKCGIEGKIRLNNFKDGQRCQTCRCDRKSKYEDAYKCFKDQGCELLENEYTYISSKSKLKYKCECGFPSIIRLDAFKGGSRCKECQRSNRIGEKNSNYKTDRTRKRRGDLLKFDYKHEIILSDDPMYNLYIASKQIFTQTKKSKYGAKPKYSIDHIQPRIAFIDNDLDNIHGTKIIKKICNLRENLRIIPKEENGSKGGKYIQEEFMAWFNDKIKEYE
jgi:hypothetical protein